MKIDIAIRMSQKEADEFIKQLDDMWVKAYPNWDELSDSEQKEIKRKYYKLTEVFTLVSYHLKYGNSSD